MKKITSTFLLLIALSFSIIADDGNTHTGGGKTCPQPGQTNCLVSNPDNYPQPDKKTIYKDIWDFLKNLFV